MTYVASGARNPQLSFTDETKTLTIGDAPYTNVITTETTALNDLTITYQALAADGESTTDVISVSTAGAVTALKSGQAIVKASWAEVTDTWKAGSISYKVYVNKKTTTIETLADVELETEQTKTFIIVTNSDGAITVESDKPAVATVSGSGNEYTITAVAKGTATITVSQAASDTYQAASITFGVKVTAPRPEGALFYETFDNIEGSGGRDGKFTGSVGNNAVYTATAGWLTDEEDWAFLNDNYSVGAYQCMKLGTGTADRFATTRSIALTGDGVLTFSAAGWQDETDKFTITATGGTLSGDTKITLVSKTWKDYTVNITGATGNLVITFTGHRGFFDDILVMPKTTTPITATFNPKYKGLTSIYYSDKNLVVPEKVTAHTYVVTDGQGSFVDNYEAGSVIPMGTPVVLEYGETVPEGGVTVTFAESTESGTAPTANMLRGFDTAQTTTVDEGENADDYYFYRLSIGKQGSGNENKVGFYWANSTGEAFTATAHKIYLALKKTEALDVNADMLSLDGLTGIDKVVSDSSAAEGVYTLSGVRVNSDNLPKGIYIVNGKKMVVK